MKLTPKRLRSARRWLYGSALASLPVLVHYDLVDPLATPLWGTFLVALLNVPSEPTDDQTED